MNSILKRLRRHKAANVLLVFLAVQLACVLISILYPVSFPYLKSENIQLMLRAIPPMAILSVGVGLLMISGEFDLSVGSVFGLAAYVMALTYQDGSGLPVLLAMALAVSIGAAIGLINALVTLKGGIPSFIATLGGMMIWRGVLLFISGKQTQSYLPGEFVDGLMSGNLGPIQAQFFWAVAVAILAHLLLERHRLGNHMFSVGGNRDAARAIGVNVAWVKTQAFIITGALAAFAGVVSAARVHSVSPEMGKGLELQAIAACVVGGLSLAGGAGSVLGIFLGAALIYTITDVLTLLRAPGEYIELFVGILIIVAVVFNRLTGRKES